MAEREWVTEVVAVIPDHPNPEPIDYNTPQRQKMARKAWWRKTCAELGGYFWIPCPVCGTEFGGHEWEGHNSSIPAPELGPDSGTGICPACTSENRGWSRVGYTITKDVRR